MLNFSGIITGLASFLIIGALHPIVIKCEYYFSSKIWPVFLILGLITCAGSLFAKNYTASCILGVMGFCFLWSIRELKQQEKRVSRGWFPKNPNRKYT